MLNAANKYGIPAWSYQFSQITATDATYFGGRFLTLTSDKIRESNSDPLDDATVKHGAEIAWVFSTAPANTTEATALRNAMSDVRVPCI